MKKYFLNVLVLAFLLIPGVASASYDSGEINKLVSVDTEMNIHTDDDDIPSVHRH